MLKTSSGLKNCKLGLEIIGLETAQPRQGSPILCDIYPYVEFAVKYPNCELELAELRPLLIFLINCGCCHPRSVLFSERTPIIKELAWVEEIAAGNIVKI